VLEAKIRLRSSTRSRSLAIESIKLGRGSSRKFCYQLMLRRPIPIADHPEDTEDMGTGGIGIAAEMETPDQAPQQGPLEREPSVYRTSHHPTGELMLMQGN